MNIALLILKNEYLLWGKFMKRIGGLPILVLLIMLLLFLGLIWLNPKNGWAFILSISWILYLEFLLLNPNTCIDYSNLILLPQTLRYKYFYLLFINLLGWRTIGILVFWVAICFLPLNQFPIILNSFLFYLLYEIVSVVNRVLASRGNKIFSAIFYMLYGGFMMFPFADFLLFPGRPLNPDREWGDTLLLSYLETAYAEAAMSTLPIALLIGIAISLIISYLLFVKVIRMRPFTRWTLSDMLKIKGSND